MDLDIPLQNECVVSGVQSFFLYLSRIFGLAPLKFESLRDGRRIRVSRLFSFYGQALTIILIIAPILALIADLTVNKNITFRPRTNSSMFLWTSDLLLVDLVSFVGAYTAINRMRYMIHCTAELKQINKQLSHHLQLTFPSETRTWFLVIFLNLLGCFLNAADITEFMIDLIKAKANVISSSLYIGKSILYLILKLYAMQFALITISVLPSLRALNECLKKINKDTQPHNQLKHDIIYKSDQTNVFQRKAYKSLTHDSHQDKTIKDVSNNATVTTLHQLTLFYCSICDVIRQLSSCNGFTLVLLFLSLLLHLIFTLYHLIMGVFAGIHFTNLSGALQLVWVVYHFCYLLLVVEPCHRTHEQLKLTKNLVNYMRRFTNPDDFALASKLKMFHRHIMLNEVVYSPMQLFVINRSFVAAIVGSITTYLIVVIQL